MSDVRMKCLEEEFGEREDVCLSEGKDVSRVFCRCLFLLSCNRGGLEVRFGDSSRARR